MSQTPYRPDKPFSALDLSQDGMCVLCWNLIARSIAQHLDANYETNPYKDLPLTANHPIIADVADDLYTNVLSIISHGEKSPTTTISLVDFLRLITGSCKEMIAHPEFKWFEMVGKDSDEDPEEDEGSGEGEEN